MTDATSCNRILADINHAPYRRIFMIALQRKYVRHTVTQMLSTCLTRGKVTQSGLLFCIMILSVVYAVLLMYESMSTLVVLMKDEKEPHSFSKILFAVVCGYLANQADNVFKLLMKVRSAGVLSLQTVSLFPRLTVYEKNCSVIEVLLSFAFLFTFFLEGDHYYITMLVVFALITSLLVHVTCIIIQPEENKHK